MFVKWVVGRDLDMLDWEGKICGHVDSMVGGSEKRAWCQCKDSLQIFNPNWKNEGLAYGNWFTQSKYYYRKDKVQAQLDCFYCPNEDMTFLDRVHPVDVLMDVIGLDYFPIQTMI